MIIRPTFLDHWRVVLLSQLLDDPLAPLYVIRLWSHCEVQRQVVFPNLPAVAIKGICRWQGDPDRLIDALCQVGFLARLENLAGWEVPKFGEYNRQLFTSWSNGSRGGRPVRDLKPNGNPTGDLGSARVTQPKPNGNPITTLGSARVTQLEPAGNPAVTQREPVAPLEKTRVEKRREEKTRQDGSLSVSTSLGVLLKDGGADIQDVESWVPSGPTVASGEDSGIPGPAATFDAFWRAFPAHGRRNRRDAEREWLACVSEEPDLGETIVAAAMAYAASPRGRSRWVKAAAAWLSGGCFLDDPASWQLRGAADGPRSEQPEQPEPPLLARIEAWEAQRGAP